MSQILVEFELPDDWQNLRMPAALHARLQELLDRQDDGGLLSTAERREGEALTELAEILSLLKLRAERAGRKALKSIPLSRLETDLQATLSKCAESGETIVVELADQRLVAIHGMEPDDEDSLIDDLLATNPKFQAMAARSKASPRKPFHAN